MSTSKEQQEFTRLLARLLNDLILAGFQPVLSEVYRTPEQQEIYVNSGKSKTLKSKHLERVAADILLFLNGEYLTKNEDYKIMAELWKSYDEKCVAGYDWGWDGNHVQYGK
jgi:hypothetical protein